MKVELSIKDDKELRNLIKDMIRGQVKSVVREDLKDMVEIEVSRIMAKQSLPYHTMERAIEEASKSEMKKMGQRLVDDPKFTTPISDWIKENVKPGLEKWLGDQLKKDFRAVVRKEIAEKVGEIPLTITIAAE